MPKVSIVVPVYNVEAYLEKCLSSLVNQSLNDIEILVVNDGGKDGSQTIIDKFQTDFPDKIKSFIKENGGLSDARNFGINRATGDYIGFVDSDDYVNSDMFEEMYSLAEKHSAEMVICNLQKVDEHGTITQKLTQIPHMPEKIDLEKHFSVFSDIGYFACNKIFKKELFANALFKKGVHFEDIQLIPQLLLNCKTLAQTQSYHYQYLERTDSITKTHTEKGLDMLQAVEDVKEAFKNSDYRLRTSELKNFMVLQGVYSFLAYLAFVKDAKTFAEMSQKLRIFMKNNAISVSDVLRYKRFDRNYLLYLPLRKKIYYLLYFSNQENLIRKMI